MEKIKEAMKLIEGRVWRKGGKGVNDAIIISRNKRKKIKEQWLNNGI